jgi:hypothetical protein
MLGMTKLLMYGTLSLMAMSIPVPPAGAAPLEAADQVTITQTVTGVGLYADLRDWDRVGALLADEITTDYVSVFGGAVATASRAQLVDQWRTTFAGFDATQHQITNVAVTPNPDGTATTRSHVRATHLLGGRSWVLGGVYTHHLVRAPSGWQVTFMGIDRLYEEGERLV